MVKLQVCLEGTAPVLFDRYAGRDVKLKPEEKFYMDKEKKIFLPALNLYSMLNAQNFLSAVRLLSEKKKIKEISYLVFSMLRISPSLIYFLDENEKTIEFHEFDGKRFEILKNKTIVKKSGLCIPQSIERPVLNLPWKLKFFIEILNPSLISVELVKNLLEISGQQIGIGTFRPLFGRFELTEFKKI